MYLLDLLCQAWGVKEGDLAVYIPQITCAQILHSLSFLRNTNEIKVRRLRGIISQGLIVHAPDGVNEDDDVMDLLNIKRYEPPISANTSGENVKPPKIYAPKYDVESFNRYNTALIEEERVIISEKIHGASGRFVFTDDQMYAVAIISGRWRTRKIYGGHASNRILASKSSVNV